MVDWEDLFAYARRTDPDTSQDAAERMSEQRVTRLMQIVLDSLWTLNGKGTLEEVCDVAERSWESGADVRQSLSPRFRPLVRMGKICDSGERGVNRSGRGAIVWCLKARRD